MKVGDGVCLRNVGPVIIKDIYNDADGTPVFKVLPIGKHTAICVNGEALKIFDDIEKRIALRCLDQLLVGCGQLVISLQDTPYEIAVLVLSAVECFIQEKVDELEK